MEEKTIISKAFLKKQVLRHKAGIIFFGVACILFTIYSYFIHIPGGSYILGIIGLGFLLWGLLKAEKERSAIDRNDFEIIESIQIGEREDSSGDSTSYYISYWCGKYGSQELTVPYKRYRSSRKGDRAYILFFDGKTNLAFPKEEFKLDPELRPQYISADVETYSKRFTEIPKRDPIYYREKMEKMSSEEKEETLSVGRRKRRLLAWMLISIFIAFILFVIYIAGQNIWVLLSTLLFMGIFAVMLRKMLVIGKQYPAYDGMLYYYLKDEELSRGVGKAKPAPKKACKPKKRKKSKYADVWKRIFEVTRKIVAVVLCIVCLFCVIVALSDGRADMFMLFGGGLAISVCMLSLKVRFLWLLYPALFLLEVSVSAFLEQKPAVGVCCVLFALPFILPVILINKNTRREKL